MLCQKLMEAEQSYANISMLADTVTQRKMFAEKKYINKELR